MDSSRTDVDVAGLEEGTDGWEPHEGGFTGRRCPDHPGRREQEAPSPPPACRRARSHFAGREVLTLTLGFVPGRDAP